MKKVMIDNFLSLENIAVAGVSSKGTGFGLSVYNQLKKSGYNVFAINRNGGYYKEIKLYKNINEIDVKIDGVVTVIPPMETIGFIKEAVKSGIQNFWMQQGSESDEAINYCKENNLNYITGECILMFAEPVESFHKFHRWINKLIKKYPVSN